MIKTIYTCDRCKAEQDTTEQFWRIGVFMENLDPIFSAPRSWNLISNLDNLSLDVCRPCLEYFGVYVQQKPNEPTPPVRTTEDVLRELIERIKK